MNVQFSHDLHVEWIRILGVSDNRAEQTISQNVPAERLLVRLTQRPVVEYRHDWWRWDTSRRQVSRWWSKKHTICEATSEINWLRDVLQLCVWIKSRMFPSHCVGQVTCWQTLNYVNTSAVSCRVCPCLHVHWSHQRWRGWMIWSSRSDSWSVKIDVTDPCSV